MGCGLWAARLDRSKVFLRTRSCLQETLTTQKPVHVPQEETIGLVSSVWTIVKPNLY